MHGIGWSLRDYRFAYWLLESANNVLCFVFEGFYCCYIVFDYVVIELRGQNFGFSEFQWHVLGRFSKWNEPGLFFIITIIIIMVCITVNHSRNTNQWSFTGETWWFKWMISRLNEYFIIFTILLLIFIFI